MRFAVDCLLLVRRILNLAVTVLGTGFVRKFRLALLLAVLFYRSLTRPLLGLVGQLEEIDPRRPGATAIRVPPAHATDEFGLLADRVNAILASSREYLAERDREILQREQSEARSEEHTSELQSLMRISYAVFC